MKRLLLVYMGLFSMVIACRKINDNRVANDLDVTESKIRAFIENKLQSARGIAASGLNETLRDIDFTSMTRWTFNKETDIIVGSIRNTNIHDFIPAAKSSPVRMNSAGGQPAKHAVTRVVFFVKDDQITEGNIIEISSADLADREIENSFIDIIANRKTDFTGHLNVNSLTRKPSNDWTIKNGHAVSSAVLKPVYPVTGRTETVSLNTVYCIDWFLIIRYYWVDGTVTQTEQYVNTTCDEDFDPDRDGGNSIEPTDSLCAQSKILAKDAGFASAISDLVARLGESIENGYRLNKSNITGAFNYTFVAGASNGVNPTSGYSGKFDGFVHNHTNGLALTFSLLDLKALYAWYTNNRINDLGTFTLGVVLPNNKVQLLRIADTQNFLDFAAANLTEANFPSFVNRVGGAFSTMNTYEQESSAFLSALQGSGMTMYEADATSLGSGAWKLELPDNSFISIKRIYCTN
jgi:hypothetical protein